MEGRINDRRQALLDRLFKGFMMAAGAGVTAWGILAWACVRISEKQEKLLDRLTDGFVLAATIGMLAWAGLSWASVRISAHARDDHDA